MSRSGRFALIGAAAVVAVVAFVLLRSGSDDDEPSPRGSSPTATTKAPAPGVERITVRDGKPVGGVHRIAVTKGDEVRLTVASANTSDEVHVHGYDLKRVLAPGRPAPFRFRADIEGAFE